MTMELQCEFVKGEATPEHTKAVREMLDDIGPKFVGVDYEVSGAVMLSMAVSWVQGFMDREQREKMAIAFGAALLAEAQEDVHGQSVQ
jgi:hypothetical protein